MLTSGRLQYEHQFSCVLLRRIRWMISLTASIITRSIHVCVQVTVCTIVTKDWKSVLTNLISSRRRNSIQKVILKWRWRRMLVWLELDQPDRFWRHCGITLRRLTIYTIDSTCKEGSLSVWMIYKVMHTQAFFSISAETHWAVPTCGSYSRCRNIRAVNSREAQNFRAAIHILFTEPSSICWIGNV